MAESNPKLEPQELAPPHKSLHTYGKDIAVWKTPIHPIHKITNTKTTTNQKLGLVAR